MLRAELRLGADDRDGECREREFEGEDGEVGAAVGGGEEEKREGGGGGGEEGGLLVTRSPERIWGY